MTNFINCGRCHEQFDHDEHFDCPHCGGFKMDATVEAAHRIRNAYGNVKKDLKRFTWQALPLKLADSLNDWFPKEDRVHVAIESLSFHGGKNEPPTIEFTFKRFQGGKEISSGKHYQKLPGSLLALQEDEERQFFEAFYQLLSLSSLFCIELLEEKHQDPQSIPHSERGKNL